MNKTQIKLARKNGTLDKLYNQYIVDLIRLKYSANEENAILRKKVAGIDTHNEFEIYNAYVEDCKKQAKALIYDEE